MRPLLLALVVGLLGACENPPPDPPADPGGLSPASALPRPPGPGLPDELRPPR